MDHRKLSRVPYMNYTYEIQEEIIKENGPGKYMSISWSIKELQGSDFTLDSENPNISTNLTSFSFMRTKKWVLENYPELLI
jgi:hypothetical protein